MSSISKSFIDPQISKLVAEVARDVDVEESTASSSNALVKSTVEDNFQPSQSVFLKQPALKKGFDGREDQFLNAANVLSLKNAASQYYHQKIHSSEALNENPQTETGKEKPSKPKFGKKPEKQLPADKTTHNLASRGKGSLKVEENGKFSWKMKNLELTGYVA